METLATVALILLGAAGMAGFLFLTILIRAYVLHVLWGWFIVTTFGLPSIGMAQAVALSLTVGYMLNHSEPETEASKKSPVLYGIAKIFVAPALTLLIGWILHRFFM